MPLPDSIAELVERFEANRSQYHKGHYNETETRIDYVNPFFAALGWDINNSQGLSEVHREVVHEDAVKIGGTTKAPDYSFRIGGVRKFFLETKKPSVNLFLTESPAFQLRRYAWTIKMPLSILTNFEEFAIYDTRIPPDKKDPAKKARLDYFKFTDYAEKWDEIASRFSHEAVLSGAFDQYAEEARDKRISVPVDVAFLSEISGWREKLARNIVQNNPDLGQRELNYAVQMIIDRIIFLRISEDRGAEPEHLLQPLMNKGGPVYPRLLDIFHRADARYNSGLFHFDKDPKREAPDDITPRLTIDDRTLREIIASVYFPESPFEFSVFPADILGQVYEQFLGKVIRISGKTAEVEDKPEVKKAGGVYYTPTYIVDYIVRNTVGKLVEGKTPAQVAKLTILDPACGSGSFLIGAYQFLIDWHLKYYTENDHSKWAKGKNATIYQFKKDAVRGELWRLTTAEKKRILLANIYGVDIDTQAVEVTKLSLLLKVLEGESAKLIDNSLKLYQERVLPDLESNIKCGNSLIGPDFYTDKDPALFDMDARLKINTFDWNKGFPDVMKAGGFDAVIGNPPYIRIQTMKEWAPLDVEFYKQKYISASKGNYDIYVVFIEKGLNLLGKNGRLGFILPSKFFTTDYGEALRGLIAEREALDEVVDFRHGQVFSTATTYTCLLFLSANPVKQVLYKAVAPPTILADPLRQNELCNSFDKSTFNSAGWLFSSNATQVLIDKIKTNAIPLLDIPTKIARGSSTGADDIFVLKNFETIESDILRTPLYATDFRRYEFIPQTKNKVIFPYVIDKTGYNLMPEDEFKQKYPSAYAYLTSHKARLEGRKQITNWFAFSAPRSLGVHDKAGMIVPLLANRGSYSRLPANMSDYCVMASGGFSISNVGKNGLSEAYLLGLLNSSLLFWYLRSISNLFRGGWITCTKQYVGTLPIHSINFSKPADRAKHDKMVTLVEQILKLHKDKTGVRLAQEKAMLQQQIEATDAQIDRLVYNLYGLTEEEIAIVEGVA